MYKHWLRKNMDTAHIQNVSKPGNSYQVKIVGVLKS